MNRSHPKPWNKSQQFIRINHKKKIFASTVLIFELISIPLELRDYRKARTEQDDRGDRTTPTARSWAGSAGGHVLFSPTQGHVVKVKALSLRFQPLFLLTVGHRHIAAPVLTQRTDKRFLKSRRKTERRRKGQSTARRREERPPPQTT